ncbi:hypothetical protein HPG69_017351 [Diceros bicornis minor]|uniref:KRAB domain-containing protein n=1 Tax=Diceros bicornis minor TaxID=77932 RepID=A0A7J7ENS5_DICBM|nr:hypothetical protein HPG69_017351 [Diceros bicornis minor]
MLSGLEHFRLSRTGLLQGSVLFEDVSVDFAQKERQLLDLARRLLYRDVVLENYRHLASLEVQKENKMRESKRMKIRTSTGYPTLKDPLASLLLEKK